MSAAKVVLCFLVRLSFHESIAHKTGRLIQPAVQGNSLFGVMGQKMCEPRSCQQVDIIFCTVSCQQVDIILCTITCQQADIIFCTISCQQVDIIFCTIMCQQVHIVSCTITCQQVHIILCTISCQQADIIFCTISCQQADIIFCTISCQQADIIFCTISHDSRAQSGLRHRVSFSICRSGWVEKRVCAHHEIKWVRLRREFVHIMK